MASEIFLGLVPSINLVLSLLEHFGLLAFKFFTCNFLSLDLNIHIENPFPNPRVFEKDVPKT